MFFRKTFYVTPLFSFFFFFFFWLRWVLVAVHKIFIASRRIFSCGAWASEFVGSITTGPSGKSLRYFFFLKRSVITLSGKETINTWIGRHKRYNFDPWARKIPWSRKWLPTPVFFPRKFHGQRSLVGAMGLQKAGHDWATECTHIHLSTRISSSVSM